MIGNNGRATKHYFVGSERSTSRLAGDPDNYDDDGNHLSTPALSTLTGRQTADLEYVFTSFNLGAVVIDNPAPPSGDCELDNSCGSVLFFFHGDHIGSSSFISDAAGEPYQFLLYLSFGEMTAWWCYCANRVIKITR